MLSPRTRTSAIAATVSNVVIVNAAWRRRTKSMLVSSGTIFRRRIDPVPSDVDFAGAIPAKPDRDQHAREGDSGEHRGRDADQQHDREAIDRPRSEHPHDETSEKRRVGKKGV